MPKNTGQFMVTTGVDLSGRSQLVEPPTPEKPSWLPKKQSAESAEVPGASPRPYGVLVADDDAGVRGLLDLGLRHEGFTVWLAADGPEALEQYRCHGAAIDVALLDVLMPGLDGPQTLTALQGLNPQIRCCFMTGDLGLYSEGQLHQLGAAVIFQKPFRLAEVAQVLPDLADEAANKITAPLLSPFGTLE